MHNNIDIFDNSHLWNKNENWWILSCVCSLFLEVQIIVYGIIEVPNEKQV